jgi:hypothetical protein
MNDDELSPELARLERELAMRPRPSPNAGLRQRILAATSQPIPSRMVPMTMTEFAVATAAAVLLCANLSMSLANQSDCGLARSLDGNRLDAAALEIAQILPDTPPREAVQLALPLQFGPYLTPGRAAPFPDSPGGRELSENPRLDP